MTDSSIDDNPTYHLANAHSLLWLDSQTGNTKLAAESVQAAHAHAALAQAMLLERVERHLSLLAEHVAAQSSGLPHGPAVDWVKAEAARPRQ